MYTITTACLSSRSRISHRNFMLKSALAAGFAVTEVIGFYSYHFLRSEPGSPGNGENYGPSVTVVSTALAAQHRIV